MTQEDEKNAAATVIGRDGEKCPEGFVSVVGQGEKKDAKLSKQASTVSQLSELIEDFREAGPVLLLSLCLVSALEGADAALLPAVFFALQEDLSLALTDLATMTLVQAVTASLVAPFWGILADRGIMRRKSIIVMGCVLQGLVTISLAAVDQMLWMTLLRALNGALLASLRPVANGILADVTSETRRGKVYGFVQMCTNAGIMAGGLIGTPLSTRKPMGIQGWRVAFVGIGALSVAVGAFAAATMTEPPRESSADAEGKERGAVREELMKLLSYFRMPTFGALVFQGWFGGIPWNAMSYCTLFYQVGGIGDERAASLAAAGQIAGAFGGLLGGMIGDRLSRCSPHHGRPLTAQISVMAGIPVAYLTFMVDPPEGDAGFYYYLGLVVFLGLTASWCGVGVNLPILTEIVKPEGRATILAWEAALESTFAAILGNAMVAFLAERVFGYRLPDGSHESHKAMESPENRRSLGKALTATCFVPWVICWLAYSLLHFTYRRDLRRVREEERKERRDRKLQEKNDGLTDMASPKSDAGLVVAGSEDENENLEIEFVDNPEVAETTENLDCAIDVAAETAKPTL